MLSASALRSNSFHGCEGASDQTAALNRSYSLIVSLARAVSTLGTLAQLAPQPAPYGFSACSSSVSSCSDSSRSAFADPPPSSGPDVGPESGPLGGVHAHALHPALPTLT